MPIQNFLIKGNIKLKLARNTAFALFVSVTLSAISGTAFAANRLEKILEAGKLTVCTAPHFAPYEFIDNTKKGQERFRGSDIKLTHYIAEKLGVEVEITPLEFSAVLAAITQGKHDLAISALSYTPARAKTIELSDPYKKGDEEGVLVRKADADKYKSWDDFDGKTVGANTGTLQEQLISLCLPKAKKQTFDMPGIAVVAVSSGKIDAAAVAVPQGEMFVKSNPDLCVLPLRFDQVKSGYVIGATKGEVELIARVNEIIKEVVDNGLYDKWLEEAESEVKEFKPEK